MNPYSPPDEGSQTSQEPIDNRIGRLIVIIFVALFGGIMVAYAILWFIFSFEPTR